MIFLAAGLIVVGVVLYLLTGEGDLIAGIARDDFPRIIGPLAIILFIMASAAKWTRGQAAQAIQALGSWAAIALVFVVLYAYRSELSDVRDRVVQELQPGSVQNISPNSSSGRGAVVRVRKGGDGHFTARAQVNGRPVSMIVDTGASTVVLKPEDAKRAGLKLNELSYTVPVDTANGRGYAARVKLERVALGELVLEQVEALVTRPGALQQSLLGMSFLSRLKAYEFSGNQLVLKS